MVRVNWTERAIWNLETVCRYIAQFDPAASERIVERLLRACDGLSSFPSRGGDAGNGCRELVTIRPHAIRYEVTAPGIRILRVRHAAQLATGE